VDLDDVWRDEHHRQLPALDGQIGRPKIAVLAERVRLINPRGEVRALAEFFRAVSAPRVLTGRLISWSTRSIA